MIGPNITGRETHHVLEYNRFCSQSLEPQVKTKRQTKYSAKSVIYYKSPARVLVPPMSNAIVLGYAIQSNRHETPIRADLLELETMYRSISVSSFPCLEQKRSSKKSEKNRIIQGIQALTVLLYQNWLLGWS